MSLVENHPSVITPVLPQGPHPSSPSSPDVGHGIQTQPISAAEELAASHGAVLPSPVSPSLAYNQYQEYDHQYPRPSLRRGRRSTGRREYPQPEVSWIVPTISVRAP